MIERLRPLLIRLLKLPPEPPAPFGEDRSIRVFQASPKFFTYRLVLWALGQVGALIGLVIGLSLSIGFLGKIVENPYLRGTILFFELMAIPAYLFLLGFTYMTLRLDYEMRWYKVTDRSLRIREGVMQVREMTMTFANIQNIEITQGPIQRMLGISDLRVKTAGGGGAISPEAQHAAEAFDMHAAYFRGVDNAEEILALMQERLRKQRSAGLGDTDDTPDMDGPEAPPAPAQTLLQAAEAVLLEARALRQAANQLEGA